MHMNGVNEGEGTGDESICICTLLVEHGQPQLLSAGKHSAVIHTRKNYIHRALPRNSRNFPFTIPEAIRVGVVMSRVGAVVVGP